MIIASQGKVTVSAGTLLSRGKQQYVTEYFADLVDGKGKITVTSRCAICDAHFEFIAHSLDEDFPTRCARHRSWRRRRTRVR